MNNYFKILAPITLFFLIISFWEIILYLNNTPNYILPKPSIILKTLVYEWDSLLPALITTS